MTAAIAHRRQMRPRYLKLFVVEIDISRAHSECNALWNFRENNKRFNFFFLIILDRT